MVRKGRMALATQLAHVARYADSPNTNPKLYMCRNTYDAFRIHELAQQLGLYTRSHRDEQHVQRIVKDVTVEYPFKDECCGCGDCECMHTKVKVTQHCRPGIGVIVSKVPLNKS